MAFYRAVSGPISWYVEVGGRWCCFTPWGAFQGQAGFYPLIPGLALRESLDGDTFLVMFEFAEE